MIFLESPSFDPYFNLALEEYVFTELPQDQAYFMLWQNHNTIVVGKNQNTVQEINQEFVDKNSIHVARRLSGGGAVYHDKGNLNFTVIVDQSNLDDFNFRVFIRPVIEALKELGVTATFNGRNDITIDDKKFSGNSQYCKNGRLLHHGCIMLDSNLANVSDALKVRDIKIASKGVQSVRSRVTTINANAPKHITMDAFKTTLTKHIFTKNAPKSYAFTQTDLDAICKLRNEKYATWEWNYGHFGSFDMEQEKKFDAGIVSVHMTAKDGHIERIRLCGDFFGNGTISELEEALVGLPLNEDLKDALSSLDISHYIHGITADDLYSLIQH